MSTASPLPDVSLADREFARFQKLIHDESGISLGPNKRELLVARLQRRLRVLGLPSFRAYYAHVSEHPEERVHLLEHVATNETHFFREPRQLAFLSQRILPRLRRLGVAGQRERRLSAWSAGCSTGEEAYTLAMLLQCHLPASEGWAVDVLATDLSGRALGHAESGRYPLSRSTEIPEPYLRACMLRGVGSSEGAMAVAPATRSLVRFVRHNLCAEEFPRGPFELVLCRNVLIYFDAPTRERVVARLVDRLAPEGLLLLGHAESLVAARHGLRYAGPFTYGRPLEGAWW